MFFTVLCVILYLVYIKNLVHQKEALMITVFISYRRVGGEDIARNIVEHFHRKYPHIEFFYDIDSMRPGKFNEQILEEIKRCDCMLLLLPPKALDRCKNEGDWVRQEIACALQNNKTIIPMVIPGFEWPAELPDDIKDVSNCQAMTYTNELYTANMRRLAENIFKAVGKSFKLYEHRKTIAAILLIIALILCGSTLNSHFSKSSPDKFIEKVETIEDNCQVELLTVLNGTVMEDGKTYNVVSGDEIFVTAGSTVSDIAFISYFFSTSSYEEKTTIEDDHLTITVPEGIAGSSIDLYVEPVASNDDGTPNTITKTGWQKYTLTYVKSDTISNPALTVSDPYITIHGIADSNSETLNYEVITNGFETIQYSWISFDDMKNKEIIQCSSDPIFIGTSGFYEDQNLYLKCRLPDGTYYVQHHRLDANTTHNAMSEDHTAPLLSLASSEEKIYVTSSDAGILSMCGYNWNGESSTYIYRLGQEKSYSFDISEIPFKGKNWLSVYSWDISGNLAIKTHIIG